MTLDRTKNEGVSLVSKEELFQKSDVLSIHLVLSDRTRAIVGADDLQMMKSTSYLINTARGEIVQEAALLDALRKKTIAGAGLDVYNQEPLSRNHPLRSLDNVVLTPHLGYYTREMIASYYEDAIFTIKEFLEGKLINVVN